MQTQKVTTFLMFEGTAAEAMVFYASLFAESTIIQDERWLEDEPGAAGTVKTATLSLPGQNVMFSDSPVAHAFTFTPSVSFFIDCESEAEIGRLYAALVERGTELMQLGEYGIGRRFGWVNDRFGVSWQLRLL